MKKSLLVFSCLAILPLFLSCGDESVVEPVTQGQSWPEYCQDVDPVNTELYPPGFCPHAPAYCTGPDGGLAAHEWPKHGSCTSLSQQAYYAQVYRAKKAIDDSEGVQYIHQKNGQTVPLRTAIEKFGGAGWVALSCDSNCRLSQVGICYAVEGDDTVGDRTPCPAIGVLDSGYNNSCQIKSCMSIEIPAKGQCSDVGEPLYVGNDYEGRSNAPVGDFEYYYLALTWTNNFCCSNASEEACKNLADDSDAYANKNLTIHGLWPQYNPIR
jgi:ribonuclease I